jgi:GNAT superfamily N-acetyltransferase
MKIEHADLSKLAEYSEHLRSLPLEDKAARFGYKVTDYNLDQFILSILKHHTEHRLWTATVNDKIVGWGHMAKNPDNSWELAVSVDHDRQRQGIGNALINTMLKWAKIHHIHEVWMNCIEENRVIQHLASKNELKTKSRGDGERSAAIELPEPTIFELTDDRLREQTEIFKQIGELRARLAILWATPILK